jgi:hypothetical protein
MNSNIENNEIVKPQKVKLTENKKEYFKKYYETNKPKFEEYKNKRKNNFLHCEICNCYITKKFILTHKRTQKHEKNLINYNPPNQVENKNIVNN